MHEASFAFLRNLAHRRHFFKGALASASLPFVWAQMCHAQSEGAPCKDALDIKMSEDSVGLSETQLFHWLQGSLTTGRGSVSLFFALRQSNEEFVDKVVLADESRETLGVRYLSANDRTVQGYVPYILFENIPFLSGKYFVFVRRIKGGRSTIYRYTFDAARFKQSNLDNFAFPRPLRDELLANFKGQVSTFFQQSKRLFQSTSCRPEYWKLDTCFAEHHVRASLKRPAKGKGFQILVEFVHPDYSKEHYLRNFVLTDPVGRLLAWKRREFEEKPKGSLSKGSVILEPLQAEDIATYRIPKLLIASLEDCPYVMLFSEDGRDALSQRLITLR